MHRQPIRGKDRCPDYSSIPDVVSELDHKHCCGRNVCPLKEKGFSSGLYEVRQKRLPNNYLTYWASSVLRVFDPANRYKKRKTARLTVHIPKSLHLPPKNPMLPDIQSNCRSRLNYWAGNTLSGPCR